MPVRFRSPIRILAFFLGGWVLIYFLFGWFGFEPVVKWGLPKFVADRSGRHLSIAQAQFDPLRLNVDVRGLMLTEPDGKPLLALARLFVDFDAASIFKRAYAFDEVRLSAPVVGVEVRGDGQLNWLDFVAALAGPPRAEASPDPAPPRLLVRHIVVEQGRVDLADLRIPGGFRTSIDPLQVELDNLSTLREDRGDYTLSARSGIGATVRWKGKLGLNPVLATGDIAVDELTFARLWPYLKDTLNMAPPQGRGALKLAYRVSYADRKLDLNLENVEARVDKLTLSGPQDPAPSVVLDTLRLSGGRFDLAKREVSFEGLDVEGGRVVIDLDADGRPRMLDWLPRGGPDSAPAHAGAATAGWRFGIGQVGVERLALDLVDRAFARPLTVHAGRLGLDGKVQGRFGGGDAQLDASGLGMRLGDIAVSSGAGLDAWLRLASLEVSDGRASLAGRQASVDQVLLEGGRIAAVRDAHGNLSILQALQRTASSAPAAATGAAPPARRVDDRDGGWRYRVGKIEARDFGLALREESVKPALSLVLDDIDASVEGVSEDQKAALPVRLQFRVRQGGRFEAIGKVSPATPSADLRLKVDELALAPAQPFLARSTNLVLASGKAQTAGRLRYQAAGFSYDGSFAIRQLRINEAGTGDPILGWKAMTVPRLTATQDRLRIGAVTLDGLDSKLVIFKDRSINLTRLLKREGAPEAPAAKASDAPAYRVDVERVHVSNGEMDFSDLSLALPFSARIHDLKGDVVGLSSKPDAAAQLELDGAVDEFGLARAVGQINLSDPTGHTDIKVVFRNVEMTTLTPYSATFAGRKIESGKLSLDLDYKVEKRQLAGDNQIVMDKLTLGERVASPTALNLPLDLAIAILQDSDGKIDLGLPVSGSLDDPKFGFGQIIWKAFVNVITKIVTAPFRSLGALMGVDSEKLDKIGFDSGSATLLPPEREKLANLAKVMARRPGLGLEVHAPYAPTTDRPALKELQLRRAIALASGRALAAGEAPGPVGTAQPETREALRKLYAERFGADAVATLQQRHQQANPGPPPPTAGGRLVSRLSSLLKTAPPALSPEDAAKLRGADIHALMLQRLLDAEVVEDARLRDLANARGEAIRSDLVGRGVAAARVRIDAPEAHDAEGGTVAATLGIAAQSASARGTGAAAPGNPAAAVPATVPASAAAGS
jgi:uncharacterized protein involved in outer membrane biogenesis